MDMKSFGRATAGVPTQSFAASNFIGTPVPQLGQVGVTPTLTNTGSGSKMHVAIIVAVLIVLGYAGHHFFFE